jgi:cytochrome c-type biogenesis protein CcmH/NrfG
MLIWEWPIFLQKDTMTQSARSKKTLELNPRSAGARWIRGMAYQQKNSYDLAIKDYKDALELSPNNPNYLAALGHVMHQVEILQEHITFLTLYLL